MSTLCPASSILTLHDGDLVSRQAKGRPSHVLLQRRIDIQLDLQVASGAQVNSNDRSLTLTWGSSTSGLCGSCDFCNLLLEGLNRRLICEISDSLLQHQSSASEEGLIVQVNVNLDSLEYLRESSLWMTGKKQVKTGEPFLVALRGHAALERAGVHLNSRDVVVPFELFAEEDDLAAKHLNIRRRPLDEAALSPANVSMVSSWLKDCDENHEKCQEEVPASNKQATCHETHFLPTRLIDVGDPSASRNPRVAITSDISGDGSHNQGNAKYIALSYCWGTPEHSDSPLKTTHKTLQDRLVSIDPGVLPRAFQDAITLARALQIQYLWIDSLCIIQDDLLDWEVQSSRMAEIFSNAYLTVIAAAGASCHDSFLRRATPRAYTIPLKSTKDSSIQGRYSLRHRPGRKWWASDKMAEISAHRWINRGWTFQEERLARRVLMFGENKFFFDCHSMERAEDMAMLKRRPDWSETMYRTTRKQGGEPPGRRGAPRESHHHHHHHRLAMFDHWQTLCNHYSRRDLTYPEDKLPAFSGMASKIATYVESEYLAGLWRGHLTHDLFWQTAHSSPATTTTAPPSPSSSSSSSSSSSQKYRAPSWSWASLDAEIRWQPSGRRSSCTQHSCTTYTTRLTAHVTPAGADPYGAIRDDARLQISGALLLHVDLEWSDTGSESDSRNPWRVRFHGEDVARGDLDVEKDKPAAAALGRYRREERSWALLVAKCTGLGSLPRGLLLRKTGRGNVSGSGDDSARKEGGDEDDENDGAGKVVEIFRREGIFWVYPDMTTRPIASNPIRAWEESRRRTIVII